MKTILFIEDESALQKTIGGALGEDAEVISALDGEIGVRLAKKRLPDLVLLDLVLPKKDGFQVLRELKEDPATASIPVIVLTNLEDMKDVQRALDLGATTYLVKSNYQLEDVLAKVREIVEL